MKPLSIFSAQKSMSSQILCCALERSINIWNPTKLGRKGLNGSLMRKATETMTESMESRLNSSGTSSQGFATLQLCGKVTDLLSSLGEEPETFTGRILFVSMFNDISCGSKDNEKMSGKFQSRLHTCKEVWYWTVIIYWSRFRKEVVFDGRE